MRYSPNHFSPTLALRGFRKPYQISLEETLNGTLVNSHEIDFTEKQEEPRCFVRGNPLFFRFSPPPSLS